MIPTTNQEITSWIIDTAQDNIPLNTKRDNSSWDPFYRAYEQTSLDEQKRIDAQFVQIIQTSESITDPAILEFCIYHIDRFFPRNQTFEYMQLLWKKTTHLRAQRPEPLVLGLTLTAHLLGALSASANPEHAAEIEQLILREAPQMGVVPRKVMYIFTDTTHNFLAIDALIKTVKPAKHLKDAIWAAGYNLRRTPEIYRETIKQLNLWPAVLRTSYLAGAKAYEKRFSDR